MAVKTDRGLVCIVRQAKASECGPQDAGARLGSASPSPISQAYEQTHTFLVVCCSFEGDAGAQITQHSRYSLKTKGAYPIEPPVGNVVMARIGGKGWGLLRDIHETRP